MCSKSDQIIVADLGEFSLENTFRYSSDRTVISSKRDRNGLTEILEVMMVDLVNTDLFTAERIEKGDNMPSGSATEHNDHTNVTMDMGGYLIHKKGRSLLNNKCHLKLQVERNMDSWRSHNVPDISVQGTLSKLEADLTLQQYKLVRGFLAYNLGECIDDLYTPTAEEGITESSMNLLRLNSETVESSWTNLSITLDLQDVSVKLQYADTVDNANNTHLALINFIKSSLKIDSFSDGSLDIDLVSQEILVRDSRSFTENSEKQRNVFIDILQPINFKPSEGSVQAEVHSRRRKDQQKYTILLNNMRVMAILDWLESSRDFLDQIEEIPRNVTLVKQRTEEGTMTADETNTEQMELILNITDSELVFVEKPYQKDTNAVILKSTTVVSYRPHEAAKVMSINLNHLEVFSCILGSEEDTALSIIDPVTLNFDVRQGVLDIQLQKQLFIRLSYNDVRMFMKMLESVPKQTKRAKDQIEVGSSSRQRVNQSSINSLIALGFSTEDCIRALENNAHQLSDAAIWLTQNASPVRTAPVQNPLKLTAIELHGSCISICVIDDCKDADVPLLEVSMSNLKVRQELSDAMSSERSGYKAGSLKGVLASDYFNRALSGWEPLIEPWRCDAEWNYSLGQADSSFNQLHLQVASDEILKLNVTTTIIELFQLVRDNWMQDYYSGAPGDSSSRSIAEIRRRSPFVPFALKNETGLKLHFTTLVTSPGGGSSGTSSSGADALSRFDSKWIAVETGTTVPFTFGPPKKLRHHDTHKLNLHQIGVRIDGWTEVSIFF